MQPRTCFNHRNQSVQLWIQFMVAIYCHTSEISAQPHQLLQRFYAKKPPRPSFMAWFVHCLLILWSYDQLATILPVPFWNSFGRGTSSPYPFPELWCYTGEKPSRWRMLLDSRQPWQPQHGWGLGKPVFEWLYPATKQNVPCLLPL